MRRVARLRARTGDWAEVLDDPSPAPPELAEYLARRSVGTLLLAILGHGGWASREAVVTPDPELRDEA